MPIDHGLAPAPSVPAARPAAPLDRRHLLKTFGLGVATLVVAGTGVGSYRVYDSAALDPGSGHAYDPWRHWQDTSGPLGAVGAAVLAANPHNTQPWLFRITHRGPYDSRPVPRDTVRALVDTAGLPGVQLHWIDDPAGKAALGALLVDAAVAVVGDGQQSRDGFAWFRGDDDAVQAHRDGLTLDAQGLSPLVLSLGKLLPTSTRRGGDDFWVTQTRTVHTRTAAAYGVLTAADPDDRATQLLAGRLLQRTHLSVTAHGLALQPMNQITERMDAERVAGARATSGPRFAELLPAGQHPLVTFRVGHPRRDARPSPRRPVADVVVPA